MQRNHDDRGDARRLAALVVAAIVVVVPEVLHGGAAWSGKQEVQIGVEAPATGNNLREPQSHNSPDLAIHPHDDRIVALADRLDAPEFSCGLHLSGDGGRSWVPADPVVTLPDRVDHCYAPQVVFDSLGVLYYLFVGLAGAGNTPAGVWLVRSQGGDYSFFSRPRQVLDQFNYQVRLAIDRHTGPAGRLHLAWLHVTDSPATGGLPATNNPIMAAYSDDGGATFSEPVAVSGPDRRRVVAPQIAVGDSGVVHVVYYDLGDDIRDYQGLEGPTWPRPWTVEAATSTDGGQTFASPVVISEQVQPDERVMVIFTMPPPSVAAADSRVYAAWHQAGEDSSDVMVAASADRGLSWTAPVVAGGQAQQTTDQLLPDVTVAADGRVELVFFDRHERPYGHLQDVTYAVSEDHGRSFATRRLTSEPSDARSGPRFHLPTAQDRVEWGGGLAVQAADSVAVAAWPDTRYAPSGTAQQDIYTTTILRPTARSTIRWWPAALGGMLGILTAAGIATARRRRRSAAAGALVPMLALAACTAGPAQPRALPGQPHTVAIGLDEFSIHVDDELPPGRTVFEVVNDGQQPHQLVLLRLPEQAGRLDTLLTSTQPKALPPTYAIPPREPGQTARFAVDLQLGRYALVCFMRDSDGTPHYQHGMHHTLHVAPHP